MKVLMIGPDRSVHGGVSGVVNLYYEAGIDNRIKLTYIGTMKDGSKITKLLVAVVALLKFMVLLPFYQIVHVHMASDNSYRRKSIFINLAALFHKKILIHQHGGDVIRFYQEQLSEQGKKAFCKTLDKAQVVLTIAPSLRDFFASIVNPEKVMLFPNTIPIPEKTEKQYGQNKILFLGRLCKEKGIYELLQCMDLLRDMEPKPHLYLGGICEEPAIEKLLQDYQSQVTCLGWIQGKEKEAYLKACDIFVLPSYFEGQPVCILEAMAYSCGIVATDVGGIPQMIESQTNGILVAPKSVEALEKGLRELLEQEDKCQKMGTAAREKVETDFSMEMTLERLVEIYGSLL